MARRTFPSARRVTEWSDVLIRITVDGVAATQTFGSASQSAEALSSTTLVRCRGAGQFRFRPAAANDVHLVGLGLIVASNDAVTTGPGAVPSPTDDADAEWIWHRLFQPAVAFAAYAATDFQGYVENFEIDSKAMRKLHPGDTLVLIADGVQLSATPVSDIAAAVRILTKLV